MSVLGTITALKMFSLRSASSSPKQLSDSPKFDLYSKFRGLVFTFYCTAGQSRSWCNALNLKDQC